jgi:phenylalanyl-tRNA synthetase beta chain
MIVSYSWLNSFFKKPLPQPEKLAEILTMHSFEVESFERKKNDWVLNIDVLPDRAGDSLSHIGIARECAAILNLKMDYLDIKIKEGKEKVKNLIKVDIKDKNCKRYSARIISNVKICPSPKWIQDKLINCGINPINNVVDATNYVMLELGQPLHAFDYDKIEGKKIIVRHAKPGEKIALLNNTEYVLDKKIMVIADENKAMAIAGIKGGKSAEIDNKTKTIVLESANFNPKIIGQTARRLNIRTDASARFENNLDPNITELALNRASSLIVETSNGEVCSGIIDVYPEKVKSIKIKLDLALLNKILGINVSINNTINILNRLEIKIISKTKNTILLEVPTFRQDLTIQENIIEEIGRIYGYDKIPSILPCSFLIPAKRNKELFFINKLKDCFKELGYSEVYNYSFISEKEINEFKLRAESINNPISNLFKYLRPV